MSDQYSDPDTDPGSDPGSDPNTDQSSDSATGSYGRTDVLTNLQDKALDLTFGDARAHTAIDDSLAWIGVDAQRHKRIRAGERERIEWTTRLAVLLRDARTCKHCGRHIPGSGAELDHIRPWSAGGSDRTENLRILCESCNAIRSNFRDMTETRKVLPCTWWCVDCWAEDLTTHWRWHAAAPERSTCWIENTRNEDLWQLWAHRPHLDIEEPLVLAYCAHCDATGYTTVTL